MNAFVAELITEQHAAIDARPHRFEPRRVSTHIYANRGNVATAGFDAVAYGWQHNEDAHRMYQSAVHLRTYDDAVAAAKSYLFTGAKEVMVCWYDNGDTWVTEWWE